MESHDGFYFSNFQVMSVSCLYSRKYQPVANYYVTHKIANIFLNIMNARHGVVTEGGVVI